MHLHERRKAGLHVNAKWFVIRLKVSALNRIQHEEEKPRQHRGRTRLTMHALQISLVTRPSHHPFLITSTVYVPEVIENWTMGSPGNDTNAKQVCSNFLLPHMTE